MIRPILLFVCLFSRTLHEKDLIKVVQLNIVLNAIKARNFVRVMAKNFLKMIAYGFQLDFADHHSQQPLDFIGGFHIASLQFNDAKDRKRN